MVEWDFWAWLTYVCIGIAAFMPAVALAVSAETNLAAYTARVFQSRWWRITPACALLLSAMLIGANRLGWIGRSPAQPIPTVVTKYITKTVRVEVPIPDPAQTAEIQSLQNQLADARKTAISKRPIETVPSSKSSVGNVTGNGNIIAPSMSGGSNTLVLQTPPARHLDNAIAAKISEQLKAIGTHEVTITACAIAGVEAQEYAAQWSNVFRAAGWKVNQVNWMDSGPIRGLHVFVNIADRSAPPDGASNLIKILSDNGIKVDGVASPNMVDPGKFSLIVGAPTDTP